MLAPPKPPLGPEALIPEARDRQRRRQILVAASIAIATAIGLGVYGIVGGFDGSKTSGTAGGPAGLSSCRASQLAMSVVFHGGLTAGGFFGGATIRNTSVTSCALPSTQVPIVQILWRGAPVPLKERHPARARYLPRSLAPGKSTTIGMAWQNSCATPHVQVSRGGSGRGRLHVLFRIRFGSGPWLTAPNEYAPSCLAPDAPTDLELLPARY